MKKAVFIILILTALLAFAACGETAPAEEQEAAAEQGAAALPTAQTVEVTTDNQGEDAQHVNFIIGFDGDVTELSADDFEVILIDDPVPAEDIALSVDGATATLTATVFAVKAGHMDISYTGSAAVPFTIEAVVSPGMELETVSQDKDAASVTARVSELFHVRGIARVLLLENGEPVPTQGDEPSQFTAVHGHEFLTLDGPAIAEKIAYCLGESYPEGYEVSCDGDTVTVTRTDGGPAELELTIQHWQKLERE